MRTIPLLVRPREEGNTSTLGLKDVAKKAASNVLEAAFLSVCVRYYLTDYLRETFSSVLSSI